MGKIDSGRVTRRYVQRIEAPPERVFPLLCPVREREWLHGWAEQVEMVHSDSGVAEEGCVFRTAPPGRPDTVWMVVRHDRELGVVEFARVTTGLLATRLQIRVEDGGDGSSLVHVCYSFAPLGDAGRAYVRERHSEEAFHRDMTWWEASMNHWLRSGEILRPALAPAMS